MRSKQDWAKEIVVELKDKKFADAEAVQKFIENQVRKIQEDAIESAIRDVI